MSCPTGSIQTFPNNLNISNINAEYYTRQATYSQTQLTFQWAEQRTPTQFRDSLKGVLSSPEGISNTLRYNGVTYSLQKLQLADATHQSWILPQSQRVNNREDLVLTFSAPDGPSGPPSPAQIIIVVPILRSATPTPTDPNYFKAMGGIANYNPSKAMSLSEFFPPTKTATTITDTLHAYYTTCAQGKNVMIIVQIYGIRIWDGVMDIVKTAFNSPSTIYGAYEPLTGTMFPGTPGTIDEPAFKQIVNYGYNLGETIPTEPAPNLDTTTVEAVDAYKCVPFDPDTQVDESGKIRIDTRTGQPYSAVNQARGALRTEAAETSAALVTARDFVQRATMGIGVFIAIVVFLIIMYLLLAGGGGIGAGENAGWLTRLGLMLWNKFLTPVTFGVLFGFIGFIIGMMLR